MSDLATAGHLRQATTQFPVSWYCDPQVFDAEQRLLLARGPGYVGPRAHGARIRATSTCSARAATRRCWCATRAASSCCPTSAGTGRRSCSTAAATSADIVCPIHRWTYDLRGELLGAPHFPDKPCLNLGRTPLAELERPAVRRAARRRAAISRRSVSRISTFRATCSTASRRTACNYNWKIVHRGLPRGLPRRPVPSRAWVSSSHATT